MEQARSDNRIRAVQFLHESHVAVCRAERERLDWILACEELEVWVGGGGRSDGVARSFAEWLAQELGISRWRAGRLINAAHALRSLPETDAALSDGVLNLDKVVELCRFSTPKTERKLIAWASRVTTTTIRRRADLAVRKRLQEAIEMDRSRYLTYWWLDDGQLALEGQFPPDQGAVIAKAIDRIADRRPDVVDEDSIPAEHDASLDTRRADALFALASARLSNDQDPDRATIVVHAPLTTLSGHDEKGCEIDGGPVIHAETVRRMSCDGRIEFVLHNDIGEIVGVGRAFRDPPAWMKRALKKRAGCCEFPGCEARRFLHAHHIQHWAQGGTTDLFNLSLVCPYHHKFVHEYGWRVELTPTGTRWFRPDGTEYVPRAPPALAMTG